jgi:hypothetical protein
MADPWREARSVFFRARDYNIGGRTRHRRLEPAAEAGNRRPPACVSKRRRVSTIMATTPEPQPPRPPAPMAPPPPPHRGNHALAIVLAILALIVTASVLAIWVGVQFLSHSTLRVRKEGRSKQVTIQTPAGTLEVNKGEHVGKAELGLPIYPGATRIQDEHSSGVELSLGLPSGKDMRLVVAKFETPDPLDKVQEFYQHEIGDEVTKFTQRDRGGKTVFEIKHHDEEKVVALKRQSGKTVIDLVHMIHGAPQPN